MIIKSPLVVGYKGEIGSFILNGLLKEMPKASNIWCVDVNDDDQEVLNRINKADYIFLCVPVRRTCDWIRRWETHLTGKIIVEQCSLKEPLFTDKVVENKDIDFVSMHILFKPSATPNIKDRNCMVFAEGKFCKLDKNNIIELGNALNKMLSVKVTYNCTTFQEHDKIMSTQQALVHRVILVLDDIIVKNEFARTYVGKRIIELAERIKSGNLDLYKLIQENPNIDESLAAFDDRLDDFDIEKYIK